jgi:hypothetical protein
MALVWMALVLMLAPMQRAWFAVIDDHHVAMLAGPDFRISAGEAAAGAGRWLVHARGGRFRPLFWVLWHLEACWAGTDPSRWHFDRLALALVTATALYLAAEAVLPPLLAALAAFTFFCGFQTEIWMRILAQEIFGAVLASIGLAIVTRRLAAGRTSAIALLPGLILIGLAGLTKESFAPLLPAALVFVYLVLPRIGGPAAALARRDRAVLVALAVLAAVTGVTVLRARLVYGPLYLEPTTLVSFRTNAWRHLWLVTKDSGWPLPVAAAAAALAWTRAARALWLARAGWLAAGALLLLVPQWIVYGGGPVEGRYLVPGSLFAVWATGLGLRTLHERRGQRGAALLIACAVASLVWFAGKWTVRDRRVAHARARATHEHRAAIDAVVAARTRMPSPDVVFRTEDPFDFERVDSAWSFLSARLGPGFRPFLLATDERRSQRSVALGDHLARLQRERTEGREHAFQAWGAYAGTAEQCLEITFDADPDRTVCRTRVVFPSPDTHDQTP